ncbi:MAG: F0F1 ATP synthase subunit delta [Alphaproteobacteria bacterium]
MPRAGETALLARRYALALYDLATEQKAVDAVAEEVAALQSLLRESDTLRDLIADPRVKTAQLTTALHTVAQQVKFGKIVGNFLALVAHNRRADLLPNIAAAFMEERARRAGEVMAEVTVAQPLTPAQQQVLTQHLSAAAGGKVILTINEDADLIGGFVVKLGSRLIDASIKGKLASLARHLREAA